MKVELLPGNVYVLSDGDDRLELTQTNYEDIFYAIPIDNGSLYLLLNDTILEDNEKRAVLKRMVDKRGGIESAMTVLQTVVKDLAPAEGAPAAPPEEESPFQTVEESDFVKVVIKGAPGGEPEPAEVDEGGLADVAVPADDELSDLMVSDAEAAPAKPAARPAAKAPVPAARPKAAPEPAEEELASVGEEQENLLDLEAEPPPAKPAKPAAKAPAAKAPVPPAKPKVAPEPAEEELASVGEEQENLFDLEAEAPPAKPAKPAAKAPAAKAPPAKPTAPPKAKPAPKPAAEEEVPVLFDGDELASLDEAPPAAKPAKEPVKPAKPAAKAPPAKAEPAKPAAKEPAKPPAKGKPEVKPAKEKEAAASFDESEFDNLPDLADDEVVSLDEGKPAAAPAAKAGPPAKAGAAGKPAGPAKPEPAKAGPGKPAPTKPGATKPEPAKPAAAAPAGPAGKTDTKPAPAAAKGKPEALAKPGYPAAAPAAGAAGKVKPKVGADGKPILTLTKLGANEFVLGYGEHACSLNKERYEKLYETCPIDTSSLFRILMAEILDGPAKAVFRKIIATAGHSKPILDALNEQVQKLDPD